MYAACRGSLTVDDRSQANGHCDNTLLESLINTHQSPAGIYRSSRKKTPYRTTSKCNGVSTYWKLQV